MKIIVTGAAGFIGSHLCEQLLTEPGISEVIGIDNFIGPTTASLKSENITNLLLHPRFHLFKINLLSAELSTLLDDIDIIYHLAAIPGVRTSWGKDFKQYVDNNILVTQKLLEECKNKNIQKFIYVSTSSVYGEKNGKVSEDFLPAPLSPYGVTKLTGEHLCHVYHKNFAVPVIILRYFTVYGPRQRPDMAFHRFIKQMIGGQSVTIFGNGRQTRDFTYVEDCVKATASVLQHDRLIGETINIGGMERASVLEVISLLEEISGCKANLKFFNAAAGEPKHTWADISKAQTLLQYAPITSLKSGLQKEYHFFQNIYGDGSS